MKTTEERMELHRVQRELNRACKLVETALGFELASCDAVSHLRTAQTRLIDATVRLGRIEESLVARWEVIKMTRFERLRKETLAVCRCRGHRMVLSHYTILKGRHRATWRCTICDKSIFVDTHPDPKDAHIGGEARGCCLERGN